MSYLSVGAPTEPFAPQSSAGVPSSMNFLRERGVAGFGTLDVGGPGGYSTGPKKEGVGFWTGALAVIDRGSSLYNSREQRKLQKLALEKGAGWVPSLTYNPYNTSNTRNSNLGSTMDWTSMMSGIMPLMLVGGIGLAGVALYSNSKK